MMDTEHKLLILTLLVMLEFRASDCSKKGVAVGPLNFLCDDFIALDNMTWWYDWGSNMDEIINASHCSNLDNYKSTFVPMIWGRHKNISSISIYNESKYILGFNEPNHFEQSNLTAMEAALLWPEIEKISGGRSLVSPSASPCGGKCHGDTQEWFDLFFQHCKGCRVDYLATHVYDCEADSTMNFLQGLYTRYGRKIWLTEFACPHTSDPEKENKYMSQISPRLESAPFMFKYSWFESRIKSQKPGAFITKAASLLAENSSTLTPLGVFYNKFNKQDSVRNSFQKVLMDLIWPMLNLFKFQIWFLFN